MKLRKGEGFFELISHVVLLFVVSHDPDYIDIRRFGFSVTKLMERYGEDGCPDHVIAAALMIPEEEVEAQYQRVIQKMRDHIGVDEHGED